MAKGGIAFITADHGNADKMLEKDGTPFTAHTTNPVPFIVVGMDRPCGTAAYWQILRRPCWRQWNCRSRKR